MRLAVWQIFVSLAVINNSTIAYVPGENSRVAFVADPQAASIAHAAWGDLASFAWPDDLGAQAGLRRALYVAECIAISAGMVDCVASLFVAVIAYAYVSAGLPDTVSKIEYLIDVRSSIGRLWPMFDLAIMILLPLAVGFIAARSSAIMSLAIFASIILIQGFVTTLILPSSGVVSAGQKNAWRNANRILKHKAAAAGGAPSRPLSSVEG